MNSHRFTYTTRCLGGDVAGARKFSRDLRESGLRLNADDQWRNILDYTCGDLSEDALLSELKDSRASLCQAQFIVGMTHLANGDRNKARDHFRASSDLKIINYIEDYMSRALLAQLDRDTTCPRGI